MFELVSLLIQAAEALAIFWVARAIRDSWGGGSEAKTDEYPASIDDVME